MANILSSSAKMKGVVFVKFSEFVESVWGDEFWDELTQGASLPSEGIYTTTINVDDRELFQLLELITQKKNITSHDAQIAFGKWIFVELYKLAPPQAHDFKDVFEFLFAVQDFIHVEVKKLNPDAILPEFKFIESSQKRILMEYLSPRKLCRFCEGLIIGLSEHTQQEISITHKECIEDGQQHCIMEVCKL